MGGVTEQDRLARVVLSRIAEPDDRRLGRLVAEVGAVEALRRVRDGDSGLGFADGMRVRLSTADAAADLRRVHDLGGRLLVPGDPEWPTQLAALGHREPLVLWVWGAADLRLLAVRSVAVVGARACTAYGESVARQLAGDLVERGWAVVSGGAYGIDAAAHRGALDAGGVTACVLAGGVDVAYPRAHESLLSRIVDAGALVSESPPGAAAMRSRFLSRNRLIAGLTRGTVVVEAALRSGTTSTAAVATTLNRPVLGVPGPVTSPASAGVHQLIRDGRAVLVTGADEVVEVVGELGTDAVERASGPARAWDGLAERERRVYDALPVRGGADPGELAITAGLTERDVRSALGLLQAARLALHVDGCWRKPPRDAPGTR